MNIKNINTLCKLIKLQNISNIMNITSNINKIKRNKGFIGQIVETFFNVKNNNQPHPDLNKLGIEIKTLPLNQNFSPKENTYICNTNKNIKIIKWKKSNIYKKINTILWIPYEGCKKIPFSEKKFLIPFIYKITKSEEKKLKKEWLEITENYIYNKNIKINSLNFLEIKIKQKKYKKCEKKTIYKNYYAYYFKKKFVKLMLNKIKYKNIVKHCKTNYRERDLNSHD